MAVEGLVRVSAARREQAVRDYKAAPKVLISEELVGMAYRRNFQIDVLAATGVSVPLEDIYGGDVVLTPEQCAQWLSHLDDSDSLGASFGVAFAVVDEVVYVAEVFIFLTEEQAEYYLVEVLFPMLWERGIIGVGDMAVKLVAVPKTSKTHIYETPRQRSAKAGC